MTLTYRYFKWFVIGCAIQILCACAAVSPSGRVLATINDADLAASNRRPTVIEVEPGKPAVLYITKAGRVAMQRGVDTKLIDTTARVKEGASYPKLYKNSAGLHALWWSHADEKNIYMTTSKDNGQSFSPVQMPNVDHGVLLPYTLLPGTTPGVLGLVYSDERSPGYQVYANRSTDGGLSWGAVDTRLDTPPVAGRSSSAQDPVALKLTNGWVVVWSDTHHEDGKAVYRLMSTVSRNDGLTWAAPTVIYVADRSISSLAGSVEKDKVVVAASVYGRGLFASVSLDAGTQWKAVGLAPGTEKVEVSGLRAAQKNDIANYTWMQSAENEKTRIVHARVDVTTASWLDGGARRLDVKVHDNTMSMSPAIVTLEGNRLAVAWIDYREIVPNVRLSVSEDDGKIWKPSIPIMDLAKNWPAGWPSIYSWEDGLAIAQAERDAFNFGDERFVVKHWSNAALSAGLTEAKGGVAELMGESKVARLRKRVDNFWSARVTANTDGTYGIYDHVYRALNSKEAHRSSMGPLTYINYSIGDVSVKGNEAKVGVTFKYEIKSILMPGMPKPVEVAPTEVTTNLTWGWVVNDWYLVYSSEIMKDQPLQY
jgi:hypothetical protein